MVTVYLPFDRNQLRQIFNCITQTIVVQQEYFAQFNGLNGG